MVLLFMYSTSWWFHEVIILEEKESVRSPYPFVVKTLRKLEIQENVLNLIIDIYKTNIIPNGKILNVLTLRFRTKYVILSFHSCSTCDWRQGL